MKISELTNGMVVTYRIGKHGENAPNWQQWKKGKIYVQRNRQGKLLIVTPMDEVCAEFREDCFFNGKFNCEEWLFEIDGLSK